MIDYKKIYFLFVFLSFSLIDSFWVAFATCGLVFVMLIYVERYEEEIRDWLSKLFSQFQSRQPKPDTIYIVSSKVAQALPYRADIYSPDTSTFAVRDTDGNIIGVRALISMYG